MNYRHAYHAANFADVLKHVALCELVRLLTLKDKALFVLDTHAGAGGYDLAARPALRTGEAEAGFLRLAAEPPAGRPAAVTRYIAAVLAYDRKFGGRGPVRHYPGSPRLVRAALRPGDRLVACELHGEQAVALRREFAGDRAVEVRQADGYKVLKALLPPPERRGLVLLDPPFESGDEFARLQRAVRHGIRRFATGCYAIWFPVKDEAATAFATAIADLQPLFLSLSLADRPPGSLAACAVAVINPPWRFAEAMAEALPWIAARLGSGVTAAVDDAPAIRAVPASAA